MQEQVIHVLPFGEIILKYLYLSASAKKIRINKGTKGSQYKTYRSLILAKFSFCIGPYDHIISI